MKLHYFIALIFPLFLFSCGGSSVDKAEKKESPASEQVEAPEPGLKRKNIVFFGNSLTAAYGIDIADGFVSLLQLRIDSLGLPYKTINAGLSGETTAGGKERVSWVLRTPVDIFVLELGGNDALRGVDPASSKENLEAIITSVKNKYPTAKIILAGMQAPPNLGERFTTAFREMYADLADKHGTELIPFFLKNVGGVEALNQRDRIHPNEAGQKILMENVWEILERQLVASN